MSKVMFGTIVTIVVRIVAARVASTAGATAGAADSSGLVHLLHTRDRVLEGLTKAYLVYWDH